MRIGRACAAALVLALGAWIAGRAPARAQDTVKWKPLFNGRDLTGWYTYVDGLGKGQDPDRIIQVHNGVIHIYKDTPEGSRVRFGYLATTREFQNYDVRFEYRWGGKKFAPRMNDPRDAGLLYHVTGPDVLWPAGIECQVQERDTGDIFAVATRVTAPIDPARPKEPTYLAPEAGGDSFTTGGGAGEIVRIIRNPQADIDGWNKVEVRVRAGSATHVVNGKVNNRWTDLAIADAAHAGQFTPLRKGRLLLQAEGAEVLYRKIEIRELP
jgi:hypothetical protein